MFTIQPNTALCYAADVGPADKPRKLLSVIQTCGVYTALKFGCLIAWWFLCLLCCLVMWWYTDTVSINLYILLVLNTFIAQV